MPRFLHSGDWQLGMRRRYLGEDAQARFDEARFQAIRRLGEIAASERCACIVVCGDVFESNAVDRRTVARALDALEAVAVPVVLLPGNHDPLDGASVYDAPAFCDHRPDHVHVLRDTAPLRIARDLEIVGAPWTSKRPGRDLLAEALSDLPPPGAATRIGVAHGAVDVLNPDRNDPASIDLANAEAALAAGQLHYLALGDRHSRTDVGSSGRIHYAGAPEPTDFDEVDPGQVLVVDVDPDHVEVCAHRVGTWRFEQRARIPLSATADTTRGCDTPAADTTRGCDTPAADTTRGCDTPAADSLDAFAQWLDERAEKARCVLRLGFEGTLDLRGHARLDDLLERARDLFASVEVWEPDCDLAVLPVDGDFESLSLSGFAARSVERLRASDSAEARDALALMVRLAQVGSAA